jgi:hypothetical protein
MRRNFRAPWSNSLTITTGLVLVALLLGIVFVQGTPRIIIAAILLASCLLMVRGYSVQDGRLYVHRLAWNNSFNLAKLKDVEACPDITNGSVRLFGIGGLFSSTGNFRNQELGNYRAYLTDSKNAVVLTFSDECIVISPDDPEEFVRAVREEYRRAFRRSA